MASLVARDLKQRHVVRHRWSLVEGIDLPLGRKVAADQIQTEWDEHIADFHAVVRFEQGRLHVARHTDTAARNVIFYNGADQGQFSVVTGEGFVIGSTIFQLEAVSSEPTPDTASSSRTQFFTAAHLRTQLSPADEHLDVVNTLLKQLAGRQTDIDAFEHQIVQSLRRVVRRADFAAVLQIRGPEVKSRAAAGDLPICQPLVLDACRRQMLVAHRWGGKPGELYPNVGGAAWAVCAPIICSVETDGDYAIYLSGAKAPIGKPRDPRALPDDQLSLVAIVADILQSVRTFHDLSHCHSSMQEFFPKPIRDLLLQRRPDDVFETAEVPAAIMFCDLRGFSRFTAQQAGDLLPAWERIKQALTLMTEAITSQAGCIGDFQGDAAMGFWGWPRRGGGERLADDVRAACQAADTLRERFYQRSREKSGPLASFACGIGIAAGPVVAGMLGTHDQRKIGVFGPAVNLAARLESMTKQLGASILLDEQAMEALEASGSELASRVRLLASIQPVGLDSPLPVYELMAPSHTREALTPQLVRLYEVGRQAFESGNWPEAREALRRLALSGDGPSSFLLGHMEGLRSPPKDWAGRVVLTSK
ncbi:MAG: adenylate/guanylate cyclase domain-containing protein [Planctomycetaceae bacterium]|nr:adenylate/guanylate cyclase domain-containing protein [Planctomycetaceae bacterium]